MAYYAHNFFSFLKVDILLNHMDKLLMHTYAYKTTIKINFIDKLRINLFFLKSNNFMLLNNHVIFGIFLMTLSEEVDNNHNLNAWICMLIIIGSVFNDKSNLVVLKN